MDVSNVLVKWNLFKFLYNNFVHFFYHFVILDQIFLKEIFELEVTEQKAVMRENYGKVHCVSVNSELSEDFFSLFFG
jgi:hypothetical protein